MSRQCDLIKMDRITRQIEVVFTLVFLLSFIEPCITHCDIPPQFWCDDADVAKQCEVFEQCQKWQRFNGKDTPLVNFTLYYESLCPDCKNFFAQSLGPAYEKISSIMDLTLVPYGNAEERKVGNKWKFQCQHGPSECTGNIIETCAINIVKNITVYFPFLLCMEASSSDPVAAAKSCSKQHPVPLSEILNCSISDEGNQMEHKMAEKTDALQPSHTYVPWVTLNGVHTEEIQRKAQTDLVKLICSAYQGQSKPSACQEA